MFDLEFLFKIFILSLVVTRIAYMLVEEEGFLGVALGLRYALGFRYYNNDKSMSLNEVVIHLENGFSFDTLEIYTPTHMSRLISCFYCTSVWVSIILSVFYSNSISEYFIMVFSISTISLILRKKI